MTRTRNSTRFWLPIIIVVIVGSGLLAVVGIAIMDSPIVSFLLHGWGDEAEFADLSGDRAQAQLNRLWPKSVDRKEVQSVSYKNASTQDSSSMWLKIQLTPAAAKRWQAELHSEPVGTFKDATLGTIERIRFDDRGSPPLRRQTGTTPGWWTPYDGLYRVTQTVRWYPDSDMGVGGALYSGFDRATSTLWVYDYSAQHDLLWSRGDPPKYPSSDPVSK